jgi:hypothetical protein
LASAPSSNPLSLSAELGEIRYAIKGAHWIADSVAMGAVPNPERTHSAPVIISAILLDRPSAPACDIRATRMEQAANHP